LEPGVFFSQDGALTYTARIVKRVLEEIGIVVIVWPPYSPYLNPIENLWAIMKHEICKLYPDLEYANNLEATLERLIEAAKEASQAIDQRVLYKFSITIPHRVEAVLAAKGWYTKY
jgi:transposase